MLVRSFFDHVGSSWHVVGWCTLLVGDFLVRFSLKKARSTLIFLFSTSNINHGKTFSILNVHVRFAEKSD
jgi:hypothetical protein